MKNQLSSKTNLALLSRTINISTTELKEILDGTYVVGQPSFYKNDYQPKKKVFTPTPKRNIIKEIKSTDEISELWEILSGLSYDQQEFTTCYEKLVRQLKKEITATDDEDELETINESTPPGSPEEKTLIEKITQIEIEEIDNETDFDELVSMYEDRDFYSKAKKHLIEKILTSEISLEEIFKLVDETFPKDSLEYYHATQKHSEIACVTIASMKSTDDSDDIAPYIFSGSDEEILLAKKIVEAAKTKIKNFMCLENLFLKKKIN